eukprot:TRINITY_DN24886_c0_g1_i1.p1 TRINITY_DN24886_c0_g1~~TRINITY_DN24886_c0_g1_i1.p1  ORF type:complete len:197 (-),score=10.90 TRINITY_DN24886_c0_g1_i1:46-636(-)
MLKVISSLVLLVMAMPAATVAQTSAVLDVAGQELEYGVGYYVQGADGGDLTLINRNDPCPFYVGQENSRESTGLPVIFTPSNDGDTIIRESADFNARFDASTICIQSTVWRVGDSDPTSGVSFIETGGSLGNPGRSTLGNWFSIDRNGEGYKLVFCPGVCDICRPRCGEIGVVTENGKRLLALYGPPALPVVFRRA